MPRTPSETGSFAKLLTESQSRLYAFVFAMVSEPHLAHDVFQEANRVLWEKAEEFRAESDFMPWAFAIARNQVRAARQRQRRDRLTFDDEVVSRIADRMMERSADHDDRQVALAECMQRLPDHQRKLVERRYVGGESLQAIAASSGRSANVIAVTMYRVRQALAQCIASALQEGAPA